MYDFFKTKYENKYNVCKFKVQTERMRSSGICIAMKYATQIQ